MKYSNPSESLDNVTAVTTTSVPLMTTANPAPVTISPSITLDKSTPVAVATTTPGAITAPANTASTTYANVQYQPTNIADKIVSGSTQLTADDLLPKYDEASDFAKENPVSKLLKEQNFLISGYHMGINTVMQSNKIPYHDLRSAPVIPKQTVGPWSQSSYESSSSNRRFFEIGSA